MRTLSDNPSAQKAVHWLVIGFIAAVMVVVGFFRGCFPA